MNYIGIDPSITSTGMVVNGHTFNYSYEKNGLTKKGNLSKWFLISEHITKYRFHNQATYSNYKDEQINKLNLYNNVSKIISDDIVNTIDPLKPVKVFIEGYSYGSSQGNLIDLVSFGSLLRQKILTITNDITIVSPNTLKLETCKMVYKPIEKVTGRKRDKIKYIYKNDIGIPGGSFTKKEMAKAISDSHWDDNWADHIREIRPEFSSTIPKPQEDINDSYLLYKLSQKK